jgi:hypothetical protein
MEGGNGEMDGIEKAFERRRIGEGMNGRKANVETDGIAEEFERS